MATSLGIALVGAAGGIIFKSLGGVGLIVSAFKNAANWGETHRTIAPAVARGIDRIGEAGAQAITNTQAHLSSECSRITGKILEIAAFGVLQYVISTSYPASCKDRPDHWVCTANDIVQVSTAGFFAATSMYAVVQMVASSKNRQERFEGTNGNSRSVQSTSSSNSSIDDLLAKQKSLIEKRRLISSNQ